MATQVSDEIKTAGDTSEPKAEEVVAPVEPAAPADAETAVDEAAHAVDEKENAFYEQKMTNRILVTARSGKGAPNRLGNYVDRARRILRCDEQLTVIGLGQAVSMACTLVELLKRQKIAEIKSLNTSVDTQPMFRNRRLEWSKPVTAIQFVLERGDHALYVADYHQRKVIEIFENNDPDHSGVLSVDKVEELDLAAAFFASDKNVARSKEFLKDHGTSALDLPTFIKYASTLIDPLLKDRVFKERLKVFGISQQDTARERA